MKEFLLNEDDLKEIGLFNTELIRQIVLILNKASGISKEKLSIVGITLQGILSKEIYNINATLERGFKE